MKGKILFIAHMDSHIACFHQPFLKWFQEQGFIVHVASNQIEQAGTIKYYDQKFQVDLQKSPYSLKNIKAYKQLKKIMLDNKYDLVHVHTPMGSIIGRLAAKATNTKPVIYTAHGFHFYRGASFINWLLYYRIEKLFSRITNEIIVINDEDYNIAKKRFNRVCKITKVHGVGVDLKHYYPQTPEVIETNRQNLGLSKDDFILTYIGRLAKDKNQTFMIKVMKDLVKINKNFKLLLVGLGNKNLYQKLINKYNLNDNVFLLGFREDINDIINLSDIIVSSSLHEGLPRNIMEGMACGKPVIATSVRGHTDLIIDNVNGYLFKVNDHKGFEERVLYLYNHEDVRKEFGERSLKMVEKYNLEHVLEEMKAVYGKYIEV